MEQINAIELCDPDVYPDDSVLRSLLEPSYGAYEELLQLLSDLGYTHEWRYYKDGKVWLCKVQFKGRTLAWMSAWKGYIKATVYIPEKRLDGLSRVELSDGTRNAIAGARNVGKSKPCMFEVRDASVLADLRTVMGYKSSIHS